MEACSLACELHRDGNSSLACETLRSVFPHTDEDVLLLLLTAHGAPTALLVALREVAGGGVRRCVHRVLESALLPAETARSRAQAAGAHSEDEELALALAVSAAGALGCRCRS